jgi:hypothetical protein
VDWLARLPYPVTLAVDGFGDVVFRATPRDDEEVVVVDSRLDGGPRSWPGWAPNRS